LEDDKKNKKTDWHNPIYRGLQLDLREEPLHFQDEYPLSVEALRIDAVVTKDASTQVKKDIGRLFKCHNLFEFKSEKDSFSKHDYMKVIGYASLYAAFKHVDVSDITITIVVTMYPREAVRFLEKQRGLTVQDMGNGIHYVRGDVFETQILESRELHNNIFLKNLRSNLAPVALKETLEALKQAGVADKRDAYLERIVKANWNAFREVAKMDVAFKEIFLKTAEEDGWLEERDKKKMMEEKLEIVKNLRDDGVPIKVIAKNTGLSFQEIEKL
jgi:hypothetical protein